MSESVRMVVREEVMKEEKQTESSCRKEAGKIVCECVRERGGRVMHLKE